MGAMGHLYPQAMAHYIRYKNIDFFFQNIILYKFENTKF